MKRVFLLIYIILFFAIGIIPAALTPFGIGLAGYEKRQLAQMPDIISESGLNEEFTDQFNDYFNDNFGLRNYMISLWSRLNYYLLGTSASDRALAGREGWLYLSATLDDYCNKETLTNEQIGAIAHKLAEVQDGIHDKGSGFVFVIAPNKNSIYPEYMPSNIVVFDGQDNYTRLVSELEKRSINHTDLKDSFLAQKGSELLYHKWDTHWNGYGAWLGYNEMIDCAGVDVKLLIDGFSNVRDWQGDLLNMVLPESNELDQQMYPIMDISYSYENPTTRVDDIDIATVNNVNDMSVVVYRDSFANQLLQYFSNSFGQARYLRGTPYNLSLIDSEMPDVVIIEIAERNIPELLNNLGIVD